MFILNVVLTYLIGITIAALLIYCRIKRLNEANIHSERRSAEHEAEMLEIGYEIKRQLLKEAAMAEPLPPKKIINIKAKGTTALNIVEALSDDKDVIVNTLN